MQYAQMTDSGSIDIAAEATLSTRQIANAQQTTRGIFLGGSYADSEATAKVSVGTGAMIAAGRFFDMEALTQNTVQFFTLVPTSGSPGNIAFSYEKARSNSSADIAAGATVTAGGAAIRANNTEADLGNGTTATATTGGVAITANNATVFGFAGALGVGAAGLAGGVDVGVLRNNTSAYIGDDAVTDASQGVDVNALALKNVTSYGVSGALGLGALAGSVSVWTIGTTYDPNYSTNGQTADAINSAGLTNSVGNNNTSKGKGTGVDDQVGNFAGVLNGYSGAGSDQTQNAAAQLKNDVPTGQVNAALNATTVPPGTVAFIGNGAQVTAGGEVGVRAKDNLTLNDTVGSGAVGFVGLSGSIANGAVISAGKTVTVKATGDNGATANEDTPFAIGLLANVSAIFATATADGNDNAYLGSAGGTGGATVGSTANKSGGLDVEATGSDGAQATVNLNGGGIFSGQGGNATANSNPTISTHLGNGSSVNVSGNVTVQSNSVTGGDAHTEGASGGIVNVAESLANTNVKPTITTYVGQATINAGGTITVDSVNGVPQNVSTGAFTAAPQSAVPSGPAATTPTPSTPSSRTS